MTQMYVLYDEIMYFATSADRAAELLCCAVLCCAVWWAAHVVMVDDGIGRVLCVCVCVCACVHQA